MEDGEGGVLAWGWGDCHPTPRSETRGRETGDAETRERMKCEEQRWICELEKERPQGSEKNI